jgi:hypothetical protein
MWKSNLTGLPAFSTFTMSINMVKMRMTRAKFISLVFLAAYIPAIFVPVNPAKNRKKNNKSECRRKIVVRSYPTIKANKKSQGYKKYLKGSKKRNYSFPV